MTTGISQHSSDYYTVTFYTDNILTTVTESAEVVDSWIDEIYRVHRYRLSHLIVGVDCEWRPSYSREQNPTALLQLCVGRRCLILQLLYADYFPESLSNFLADDRFTFVGVGIKGDVSRLIAEQGMSFGKVVDLRDCAVWSEGRPEMKRMGLAKLATEMMGCEVWKPKNVTMSNWDRADLTVNQIKYACIDAYLSFEIGRRLRAETYPYPCPMVNCISVYSDSGSDSDSGYY